MSDPTNPDLFSLLKSMTLLDVLSSFWSAEGSSPSLVVLSFYCCSDFIYCQPVFTIFGICRKL